MLSVRDVVVEYSGLQALRGASIEVSADESVAIIGSNGAGKTTLIKAIAGTVPVTEGTLHFKGANLATVPVHQRAEMGIVHVPEGRFIFPSLTVMENLEVGAYRPKARARFKENLAGVLTLFPVLEDRCRQLGGTLSGGEQQMLAIGRGLMAEPELLILDEPSLGLAPLIVEEIFDQIRHVRDQGGMAVLIVEQRAVEALDISSRGYVLESGRVVMEGDSDFLLRNERVRHAYLGV